MPKTIHITEDHNDSRIILRFLLEKNGYNVIEAKNGVEAIEAVTQQIPDLILMDLSLPEIDGVVATKLIRQIEGAAEVPIFAMTSHWSVYHPKAKETGLNGVLQKPLNHTKLLNLVNQFLA